MRTRQNDCFGGDRPSARSNPDLRRSRKRSLMVGENRHSQSDQVAITSDKRLPGAVALFPLLSPPLPRRNRMRIAPESYFSQSRFAFRGFVAPAVFERLLL